MVVNFDPKKRRKCDDDADWLPQKARLFVLKQALHPPLPPIPEQKSRTTDKEGLDRAYKTESGFYRDPEGTLHVAGTRGGFLESDWIENYKVYGLGWSTSWETCSASWRLGRLTGASGSAPDNLST